MAGEAELLEATLRHRLRDRLHRDTGMGVGHAGEAVDAAVAWLGTVVAAAPGQPHRPPSPEVDAAWHTFILHTRDYAAFCQRVAGGFIHHTPEQRDCAGQRCYGGDCTSGGPPAARAIPGEEVGSGDG